MGGCCRAAEEREDGFAQRVSLRRWQQDSARRLGRPFGFAERLLHPVESTKAHANPRATDEPHETGRCEKQDHHAHGERERELHDKRVELRNRAIEQTQSQGNKELDEKQRSREA